MNQDIVYKIKTASLQDIFNHLNKCKDNFIPELDKTVDIKEYAKKIFENSITFEAWIDNIIVGLVAAYINDTKNSTAYITNVSVIKEYFGKGISSKLLQMSIDYAKEQSFKEIKLEVNKNNIAAINLYDKFDFIPIENKADFITMKLEIL